MQSSSADAKQDLLDEVVREVASRRGGAVPDLEALLQRFYRHVTVEDLAERSAADISGAALSQRRTAMERPQGTATVHVFTPTVDEHGWSAEGHTVVEIITDDMPFLVDSVTMELARHGRDIHFLAHPQFLVRRDVTGTLLELVDAEADLQGADDEHDVVRESWMHVEIDRESDVNELAEIQHNVTTVLRDVREAVEDWRKMQDQAEEIVKSLRADPPAGIEAEEVSDAAELLEWLADDHFTFLGYREYVLETEDGEDLLRTVQGSGLGILRGDQMLSPSFAKLPPQVQARAREKKLLIITKANSRATVHRSAYLDYVGVKTFDEHGDVVGERRFLGLFSSGAYTESLTRIPLLRRKAAQVIDRLGFDPNSHSGKALMDILETYPRDELFQTPVDELVPIADAVLHLHERRALRLFLRQDIYGRYLSCLVYLPRDRYNTKVRERIQELLLRTLGGQSIDYTVRVSESVLARLHFVVRLQPGQEPPAVDVTELEHRLAEATRSWADDFTRAVTDLLGEEAAAAALRRYADAFPEAYKEDFPARTAAGDLRRLEQIPEDVGIALSLYEPVHAEADERRFKVFCKDEPLSLSQMLPLLTQMGVEVVDERPYELLHPDGKRAYIYDFGLRYGQPFPETARDLFQDEFLAAWRGVAESDGFNRLVLAGGFHWRQVSMLRAYQKYLRQGGTPFSQQYIEDALVANVSITKLLVQLFEARFDPGRDGALAGDSEARVAKVEELESRIQQALEDVASLDQDRILRSYLTLIEATLRTNYFQLDDAGNPKSYLSFKVEPKAIPDLPEPRPAYEIFVYSPRVEGVHLRFGAVARGGLRWSDRREDFRTEVLGLVKAQMVKNTVIVPSGAKGGFFCKQLPPATDREAWLAEGIACYKTFISGLLDITDNLVDGQTVPPSRVVRHDGDDSYLVVAADKGTASFSDIANGVAKDYGFWLGDAFASGGSVGYDHKGMGITARGAWVSVQRHFREMGIDCQTEDFTAVGVGDMSGDVFGNGMLRSEHTRLVAAFDHRHIFLDPDPDPATSYAERRRLFELPRSSWADYSSELISEGGGVHPRTAKSIDITPQVRAALGLDDSVLKLTPNELMRAVLQAPVDLLWNGGIGTYVKAESETDAEVGDRANDAIRVNGGELRCRCVGEGGNLGCTQLGRIEYARAGGRINTDFIDNSAGVGTSDHEVNIKILLDRVVRDGDLTEKQRNQLLASMTDELGAQVLQDNYQQNLALASSLTQAPSLLHVHEDWIRRLEKAGLLNRALEFLPDGKQIRQRHSEGQGLTSPELCVLLAYTKIALEGEILAGGLPDDSFLRGKLYRYFPHPMRSQYRHQMDGHPLRREIIGTAVVNDVINQAGITFYPRLSQETGSTVEDLFRANLVAREIYAADGLIDDINALDNQVPAQVQIRMRLQVRTLTERATRWLVNNRRPPLDADATVDRFDTEVQRVMRALPELVRGREAELFENRRDPLLEDGVPQELAEKVAALPPAYSALSIVEIALQDEVDVLEVAATHFAVQEALGLGALYQRVVALPRQDRWQTMARAALRDELHNAHAQITAQVLASSESGTDPDERVEAWSALDPSGTERGVATLHDICADDAADLARLSVGLRVVRGLVQSPV